MQLFRLFEAAAGVAMEGALAGEGLPAADDGVAVNRVELEDVGAKNDYSRGRYPEFRQHVGRRRVERAEGVDGSTLGLAQQDF